MRGWCPTEHKQLHDDVSTHGMGELQDTGAVRERSAVAGVVHQTAGQEHWTHVISIQHIHCQRGGGGEPVGWIRRSVLLRKTNKSDREFESH